MPRGSFRVCASMCTRTGWGRGYLELFPVVGAASASVFHSQPWFLFLFCGLPAFFGIAFVLSYVHGPFLRQGFARLHRPGLNLGFSPFRLLNNQGYSCAPTTPDLLMYFFLKLNFKQFQIQEKLWGWYRVCVYAVYPASHVLKS